MLANNTTPAPTTHPTPEQPAAVQTPPKKKRKSNWRLIAGILALAVLLIGGAAGYYLVQQQQDIRQQAVEGEPGGGGGCLGTQRSNSTGTCGGNAIEGCTNDCSCGYTGGACGGKQTGNPCWSDGQCQSGQCSGSQNNVGTCQAGTGTGECPSGFQETQPSCNNNQYLISSGGCFKCQEAKGIQAGQFCDANKCICQSGPSTGSLINSGQRCARTCWQNTNAGCVSSSQTVATCTSLGEDYYNLEANCIAATSQVTCWKVGSNFDCTQVGNPVSSCDNTFGLYTTQSECRNAASRCYDSSANCTAKYFTRSSQTCQQRGSTLYSTTQACFDSQLGTGGSGVQVCCQLGTSNFGGTTPGTLTDCQNSGGTVVDRNQCSGLTSCSEQMGSTLYNQAKTACQSSPGNVFDENECRCKSTGSLQITCNEANVGRCMTDNSGNLTGYICTESQTSIYTPSLSSQCASQASCEQLKNSSTCALKSTCSWNGTSCVRTSSTGGGGGGTDGQYQCSNPDKQGVPVKKWLKFTCDNGCYQTTENGVTAWRCYDNRVESTTGPLTLDGECGQVDQLSGDSDATYCGLEEYTCGEPRCQTGGTPPPGSIPSPSPSPTPAVGPQCLSIAISNPSPSIGESVTFTCGAVSGITNYQFRVITPNGDQTLLAATGRTSAPYTVPTSGRFAAQCRVCNDAFNRADPSTADAACQPWENVDLGGGNPPPTDERGSNPIGSVNASCDTIVGWTCDADDFSQPLKVQLFDNTPDARGALIGEVTASRTREQAVADLCGGNAAHGYQIAVPDSMKDGTTHNIYALALNIGGGSNAQLAGSPKALDTSTCTGASFSRDN